MSIFAKKKSEPVYEEPVVEVPQPVIEPEPQPEPQPEEPKMPEGLTVIGVGTVFVGDITTSDRIDINGTVKGNIQSVSDLNISGTGLLYGNADVAALNVDGTVQGEICCSGTTRITNSGVVKGTLTSACLNTADGATIDGSIQLGAAAQKKAAAQAETEAAGTEPAESADAEPAKTTDAEPVGKSAANEEIPQDAPVSIDELFG